MKVYLYLGVALICGATLVVHPEAMAGSGITPNDASPSAIKSTDDPSQETSNTAASIGSVKTVQGSVSIIRHNRRFRAKVGTMLLTHDSIVTEKDGAVGVTFKDNAVLSVGPKSKIVVDDFAFNPESNKFSMITNMLKGTCTYLGGMIAKLKPRAVLFSTPSATIGIRGTYVAIKVGL